MMSSTRSDGQAARLAPHPILKRYYDGETERKRRVNELFDSSAKHYDWITSMMSFGTGRWYRGDCLRRYGLKPGSKLLDVGCGTGVLALLAQGIVGETGRVVAVDPSEGMLAVARAAGVRDARLGRAEQLEVPDDSFDLLTMGYALRHVEDLRRTFREYLRVLEPGGRVLILEITRPETRLRYWTLRVFLKRIVPLISWLRGSRDARILMEYYWDTIQHCVPPQTILDALKEAGFVDVKRNVMFGMLSEYTGVKPARD